MESSNKKALSLLKNSTMKGLLKTAVLLVIFCATAMACGGGGEDALDHKGGDGGGTGNKGDQEEPEQPFVAHITPVDKLNQGVPVINSHADVTSRSSLKMNFRTYSQLGESVLKSAKPNYVRVKTTIRLVPVVLMRPVRTLKHGVIKASCLQITVLSTVKVKRMTGVIQIVMGWYFPTEIFWP